MTSRSHGWRTAAVGVAAGAAGLTLGLIGIAGAQDSGSSPSTTAPSASAPAQQQPRQDPATMDHGPDETLLTGDTADKVTAAAKKAIPDGTIIRVETDSDGSPYEAHVRKADGTEVTLKFDSSFSVTATEDGFGRGPGGGHHGPRGQAPQQPGSATTTTG